MEASWDALQLFFMILVLVLVVFSSAIYYMERGDWDEVAKKYYRKNEMPYLDEPPEGTDPSPFQSIPQSVWWCMVTLTTVGYGDVVPVTYAGQIVATATMLVGLIMLALPLSIIGTNFIEERNKMKEAEMAVLNELVPQKEEDKVKSLQGSRHAIAVTERCIKQATHTVELQSEMQDLMQNALTIIERIRQDPETSAAASPAHATPSSTATSLLGLELSRPELAPPCMVQARTLAELQSLCAQVIDMSQQTVDVWEGDVAGNPRIDTKALMEMVGATE